MLDGRALVPVDPVVLVAVAVVSIPLVEGVRAVTAVALGDDTPRAAGRLWRLDRNLGLFGTVLVPALLALAAGVAVGWPAAVPVAERALSRPRRLLVALVGPATHLSLALLAVLAGGSLGAAAALVNLLTAALLLVPAPPLPGGAVVTALVPSLDQRGGRWDRWRRTEATPWALAVLVAAAVAAALR